MILFDLIAELIVVGLGVGSFAACVWAVRAMVREIIRVRSQP